MATAKKAAKKPPKSKAPRKKSVKKAAAGSAGLEATKVAQVSSRELDALAARVADEGGAALGRYADPLGGHPLLLAALPLDKVAPTPFQRDLSETHHKRLADVIHKTGQFLDPIIAIRHEDNYWTPNGNHRLQALRKLGVRTIVALLVPDPQVAFKILALNTEKAHNLREKALEVIRMARDLAPRGNETEKHYALEFEEPAFLTLGCCYEKNGRFAGGADPVMAHG